MENAPPPVEVVTRDSVTYRIRRLTEVSQVLPRLEKDRVFCAYALCQLEPERFPHTRWYVADGEDREALVMSGTGSLRSSLYGYGADLFCMGEPDALAVLLSLHPGPRYVSWLWAQVEHGPVLKRHFRLVEHSAKLLLRDDRVDQGTVEPPVRRLTGADIREINRLFRACGGSLGHYRRKLIDRGLWYGFFEDGRLIAITSNEAISPTYGVMLAGRSLTHPRYRGKHYIRDMMRTARIRDATAAHLMRVATVDSAKMRRRNRSEQPSVEVGQVLESRAYRRDQVGLASLIRRVLARRRAGKSG